MDQEAQRESRLKAWLYPDELLGLFHDLRAADYRIGVEHYTACLKVMLCSLVRGLPIESPDQLKSMIRPILCSSREEQEQFGCYFKRWLNRIYPVPEPPPTPPNGIGITGTKPPNPPQLNRNSRLLVACFIAAMLGVSFFLMAQGLGETQPEENGGSWQQTTAFFAILVVALTVFYKRRRGRLFLLRKLSPLQPATQNLVLKKQSHFHLEIFSGTSVHQVAQALRQRGEAPSTDLDIGATISATVMKAGWFQPHFAKRRVVPEYLALIDRNNFRDQKARMIEEMLGYLSKEEVFIKKYNFVHDPRLCFPAKDPQTEDFPLERRESRLVVMGRKESRISLADLQARFPEHRLLIFSDAESFFSPATGELESWVESLKSWSERALFLSTRPPIYQLRKLQQFFRVLPSDGLGLGAMANMSQGSNESTKDLLNGLKEIPVTLAHHPLEWLDDHPPPLPTDSNGIPEALEEYLDPQGLLWLRACAVYPALDWNLTLHLGKNLPDVFSPQRLHRLISLPWLRYGYIPDWLRGKFTDGISVKDRIRKILYELFSDAKLEGEEGKARGFKLKVTGVTGLLGQIKNFLRKAFKRIPIDSPLLDCVFLEFMSSKLAFPLPTRVALELGKRPIVWPLAETRADLSLSSRVQRFSRWLLLVIVLGYLTAPVVAITLNAEVAAAFLLVLLGIPLSMIALSFYDNRLLWVGTINATFMILAAFLFPFVGHRAFHMLLAIVPVWMSFLFFHAISEKEIVKKKILYQRLIVFLFLPWILSGACLTGSPSLKLVLLMVASLGILLIVYGFFRNISSVAWLGVAYFASLPIWSLQYFSSAGPAAVTWVMRVYCLGIVPLLVWRAWRHWR